MHSFAFCSMGTFRQAQFCPALIAKKRRGVLRFDLMTDDGFVSRQFEMLTRPLAVHVHDSGRSSSGSEVDACILH